MDGGAKAFFFSAVPPVGGDRNERPGDGEMFAGFRGGFGSDAPNGAAPLDDFDDDAWLPPMGDGGPADRDEMFKAFGFEQDPGGIRPPGSDDDAPRGFMQWDDEGGFEGPDGGEGGLNQFFMMVPPGDGPDGVPDEDGQGPMDGGAKAFFFSAVPPVLDSIEEVDDSESTVGNGQQTQAPPQKQDFFNPGETDIPTQEEVPKTGFFKPEAEPKEESEAPAAAFFANTGTSSTSNKPAPRPSFFNPGGVNNLFGGGSSNNEVREDSELTRDDDRQFETNSDSDGQAQPGNDRNDEDKAEAP